jgi:hypothetical protein
MRDPEEIHGHPRKIWSDPGKKRYREVWEDILLRRFFCPKNGRIRGDIRRSRRYLEHKQGDADER